jgi:hypothetical protein
VFGYGRTETGHPLDGAVRGVAGVRGRYRGEGAKRQQRGRRGGEERRPPQPRKHSKQDPDHQQRDGEMYDLGMIRAHARIVMLTTAPYDGQVAFGS